METNHTPSSSFFNNNKKPATTTTTPSTSSQQQVPSTLLSNVSIAINDEISRFESVHPSIYAIYELIEGLSDVKLANEIREHVVNIEDSFVCSQEWTLSPHSTPLIHMGLLGAPTSPKSTLVHRYLTTHYLLDHSPEGGRFKKEILLEQASAKNAPQKIPHLLLIRDEGGPPELQFTHWVDVLLLVAGSHDDVLTCFTYAMKLNNYKSLNDIPIVLVADGDHDDDTTSENFIAELKKIPHNLFLKTNSKTGENVENCFISACNLFINGDKKPSNTNSFPFAIPTTPTQNSLTQKKLISRRKSNIFQQKMQKVVNKESRQPLLKQGYLNKKSIKLKKWKKKYVILTETKLSYYDNMNNYIEKINNLHQEKKFVDLKHANVKPSNKDKEEKTFIVTTVIENKCLEFETNSKEERDDWIGAINKGILKSLTMVNEGCHGDNEFLGKLENSLKEEIFKLNGVCADCHGDNDVSWIVTNFGVVVCIGCSGVHRGFGCHVSRVRSVVLDSVGLLPLELPLLLQGNKSANEKIYEANLDKTLIPIRDKIFLTRKYVNLEFTPFLTVTKEAILKAIVTKDFHTFLILLLRVEKFRLRVWAGEVLGEIWGRISTSSCSSSEGDKGVLEWGAWLQVVVWGCEEFDEVERKRIAQSLSLGFISGGGDNSCCDGVVVSGSGDNSILMGVVKSVLDGL